MRLAIVVAVLAMFVASAMAATQCDQNTNYSSPVVDLADSKIGSGTELKFYVYAKTNQSVGLKLEFNANGDSQCSFIHAAGSGTTAATQGYWVKTSSTGGTYPCDTYVFTATVPNAIRNCGWGDGSVTGTISTWENKLKITTQVVTGEAVYGDAITRTDVQVLKYSISYLTAVNATSTATVLPSALAFTAVTTQTFNSASRVATVSFATSVQGPYQVNIATVSGNTNWTAAIGTATTNCATAASGTGPTYAACFQTTVFTLTPATSDVCKLSGTITGTISFSCQSTFTGACDSPNPPSAPFTFAIASDDFCPRLVEVGDLSANMYLSATPADRYNSPLPIVAADYTASSVVYGSVIFSNEATLSIDKVYPQTITIISNCAGTGCPQNLVIYDLAADSAAQTVQTALRTAISWSGILAAGDPVDGVEDVSQLNQYVFEFVLNEASVRFDNGEQSGNVNVQVTITFKLEYNDVSGQKMTEFRTLALTPAGVSASASAGIGQAGVATSSESTVLGVTQGTVVVVGCTFAALLVAVVAASVVVSRRRAATKAASKAQLSSSQVNLTLRQSPSAAATSAGLVNLSTQNLQTVQSAYDASIQA